MCSLQRVSLYPHKAEKEVTKERQRHRKEVLKDTPEAGERLVQAVGGFSRPTALKNSHLNSDTEPSVCRRLEQKDNKKTRREGATIGKENVSDLQSCPNFPSGH